MKKVVDAANAHTILRPMKIDTIEALVEAFGGNSRMAEKIKVVPSAITNWKRNGYIPWRWLPVLRPFARRHGWKLVEEKLFG